MLDLAILLLASFAGSTLSGVLGMGGGILLLAVMANLLEPTLVVPVHGVVQLVSNTTRSLRLIRQVIWTLLLMYVPALLLGAALGIQLYRGSELGWFKPLIGCFVLAFLLWERLRPARLELPRWLFVPGGFVGGLLSILVGATGPWLAAFFLRDDLDRKQVVATKAAIQTVSHLVKIPAFISIGFAYGAHLKLILPLLAAVVLGTLLGTWLLHEMKEQVFRTAFRVILAVLALRLILGAWL
jgi:uncharacterized membrane protein YfcA